MPMQRIEVQAPPVERIQFDLLDTIPAKPMPEHAPMGGITYPTDFCGVAVPWLSPPCEPLDYGTISISVGTTRNATITGTGEPAGGGFTVDWGDGNADTGVALDGQTNTYTTNGSYTVTVTRDGYLATVDITVTNGVASGPFVADAAVVKYGPDGLEFTDGDPITVYHLWQCRLLGSVPDPEGRALRSLDLGASRAVEEGFGTVIGTGATDITPSGTAVALKRGLALLEQHAGENYGGRPVIHMTRLAATLLDGDGMIEEKGGVLRTKLGSLVVAGAGYGGLQVPSAPAAGAEWMYVTGAVNIWQGAERAVPTALNKPFDNQFSVLAERAYIPTYECFHAAVEVTTT